MKRAEAVLPTGKLTALYWDNNNLLAAIKVISSQKADSPNETNLDSYPKTHCRDSGDDMDFVREIPFLWKWEDKNKQIAPHWVKLQP